MNRRRRVLDSVNRQIANYQIANYQRVETQSRRRHVAPGVWPLPQPSSSPGEVGIVRIAAYLERFLAVATSIGGVYWYDLQGDRVTRLFSRDCPANDPVYMELFHYQDTVFLAWSADTKLEIWRIEVDDRGCDTCAVRVALVPLPAPVTCLVSTASGVLYFAHDFSVYMVRASDGFGASVLVAELSGRVRHLSSEGSLLLARTRHNLLYLIKPIGPTEAVQEGEFDIVDIPLSHTCWVGLVTASQTVNLLLSCSGTMLDTQLLLVSEPDNLRAICLPRGERILGAQVSNGRIVTWGNSQVQLALVSDGESGLNSACADNGEGGKLTDERGLVSNVTSDGFSKILRQIWLEEFADITDVALFSHSDGASVVVVESGNRVVVIDSLHWETLTCGEIASAKDPQRVIAEDSPEHTEESPQITTLLEDNPRCTVKDPPIHTSEDHLQLSPEDPHQHTSGDNPRPSTEDNSQHSAQHPTSHSAEDSPRRIQRNVLKKQQAVRPELLKKTFPGRLNSLLRSQGSGVSEEEAEDWKGKSGVEARRRDFRNVVQNSLQYGPPSESSTTNSVADINSFSIDRESVNFPQYGQNFELEPEVTGDGWLCYNSDLDIQTLLLTRRNILLANSRGAVVEGLGIGNNQHRIQFTETDIKGCQISGTYCGSVFWKFDAGLKAAFCMCRKDQDPGSTQQWQLFASDVTYCNITGNTGVVGKVGEVEIHPDLSSLNPCSLQPRIYSHSLRNVETASQSLGDIVLLERGKLFSFPSLGEVSAEGGETHFQVEEMKEIAVPSPVTSFVVGNTNKVVILDSTNVLYYCEDWKKNKMAWFRLSLQYLDYLLPGLSASLSRPLSSSSPRTSQSGTSTRPRQPVASRSPDRPFEMIERGGSSIHPGESGQLARPVGMIERGGVSVLPVESRQLARPGFSPGLLLQGWDSLWVKPAGSDLLLTKADPFCGYFWFPFQLRNLPAGERVIGIDARNMEAYSGVLVVRSESPRHLSQLWFVQRRERKLQRLPLPTRDCQPWVTASCPGTIWVQSERGELYRGEGSVSARSGFSWSRVGLIHLDPGASQLHSIQLGHLSAWALDKNGRVFFCENPTDSETEVLIWTQLDSQVDTNNELANICFVQLACSANSGIVWALDSNSILYSRQAIYPDLPMGAGWHPVHGALAVQIVASRTGVWILSPAGDIFRRTGISDTNWVGEYWEAIPKPSAQIVWLSCSQCDTLYCLDSEARIHSLARNQAIHILTDETEAASPCVEEDWTMI